MKQCKDQNNLNNLTLMNWYPIHKDHLNDLIHEFVLAQEPERSQRIFWILQLRRQKEESNRALQFWLQVKVSKISSFLASFMYAAKNKNYFSEKKETVVVSLVQDSVIQSVILILACFYKTGGDTMSCEELTICSISCIYPPCKTKSWPTLNASKNGNFNEKGFIGCP